MNHSWLRRAPGSLLLFACTVAATIALAACSGSSGTAASHSGTPTPVGSATPAYYGALVTPPPPKPDVTLTDTSGQPFSLRGATKGSLTLLYMGYTNCPDECPTFMAQLGTVMQSLSPDVRDKVKVVFITTDPDRDTPGSCGAGSTSSTPDSLASPARTTSSPGCPRRWACRDRRRRRPPADTV